MASSARRASPGLLALALLLAVPGGAGAEVLAVLPIEGPAGASEISPEALGLRPGRGTTILAPRQVKARLARAAAGDPALGRARALVDLAEQAGLHMERRRAVSAARRALEQLETVAGRYAAPRLFARALCALALAELLRPEDPTAASAAFGAALVADPALRPDRGRMSSRARQVLAEARRTLARRRPPAPSQRELAAVARGAAARHVAWVAVDVEPRRQVRALLYDGQRDQVLVRIARPAVAGADDDGPRDDDGPVATTLRAALAAVPGLLGRPTSERSRPRADRRRRRHRRARAPAWYKRWWVWALVGGVVVGTGVAVAVAASGSGSNDRYGFEFRF